MKNMPSEDHLTGKVKVNVILAIARIARWLMIKNFFIALLSVNQGELCRQ